MKKVLRFFAALIMLIAASAFGIILHNSLNVSAEEPEKPGIASVVVPKKLQPNVLSIPALKVSAHVQQVGIAYSGNLGIPTNFTDVGWYKYGPAPGSKGNAIIDGHRDNALALPGVFKNLDQLEEGDDVYITTGAGKKLHFRVTKKELLNYNSTNTKEIFGASNTANLILITCEGDWNQAAREYSQRLVVFTTLVQ
jgi:sortase A